MNWTTPCLVMWASSLRGSWRKMHQTGSMLLEIRRTADASLLSNLSLEIDLSWRVTTLGRSMGRRDICSQTAQLSFIREISYRAFHFI